MLIMFQKINSFFIVILQYCSRNKTLRRPLFLSSRTHVSLWDLLGLLVLIGSLFSCAKFTRVPPFQRTLTEKVIVEKSPKGEYTLQFTEKGKWEIYTGKSEDKIDWSQPIKVTTEAIVHFNDFPPEDRVFFGIKTKNDKRFIASERLLPIKKAYNFRDMGGISTKDDKSLKWGKVYRSGKLSDLTPEGKEYFRSTGIKTVVDFRSNDEIAKSPNRYPKDYDVKTIRVPIGDEEGNVQKQLKEQISNADDNFDSEAFVANVNKTFVDSFAYQYKPFMELFLEEKNYPILFHCSAGKDRTGFAAMLVLGALGVEEEVIVGDFMMSNYYRHEKINKTLRKTALIGKKQKIIQPLVEVRTAYIQAALNAIKTNYGDMDTFLEKEYDLDASNRAKMRRLLLTSYDETKNKEKKVAKNKKKKMPGPKKKLEKHKP